MNIREGALIAPPGQDKVIRDYLEKFRTTFQNIFYERERIPLNFFKTLLPVFERNNLSLNKKVKLTIKFVFDDFSDNNGWLDEAVPNKHYRIFINIPKFVTETDDDGVYISDIDWQDFFTVFIHEYKHFIQTLKAKGSNFANEPTKAYLDQPDEQQAWAEGYLETLKHQLGTTDSQAILNYVQKHELSSSPTLQGLKKSNPTAWKRIMKQVVLAAVRDLNQK